MGRRRQEKVIYSILLLWGRNSLITQFLTCNSLGFFQSLQMKVFPQHFQATHYSPPLSLVFFIMLYLNLLSWKLEEQNLCLPVLFQLQKKLALIFMRFTGKIHPPQQAICCVLHATPHIRTLLWVHECIWREPHRKIIWMFHCIPTYLKVFLYTKLEHLLPKVTWSF